MPVPSFVSLKVAEAWDPLTIVALPCVSEKAKVLVVAEAAIGGGVTVAICVIAVETEVTQEREMGIE